MTMQEIFNIAAPALLAQDARSFRKNALSEDDETVEVICAYRSTDGLKCAIGHIIPDSIYREEMEGRAVLEIYTEYEDFKNIIGSEWDSQLLTFLTRLQEVHDNYEPFLWSMVFRDLAADFNLNADCIK